MEALVGELNYLITIFVSLVNFPEYSPDFWGLFNQTAIVLRYSTYIKRRKTIKAIKTESCTHKHNMTLIVSS